MAFATTTLDKPVRIVLGFPPGAGFDATARVLAEKLTGSYAPAVIVDNKPGAGGRLAVESVKSAAPDGQTILFTPASPIVLYPHVFKKVSYDPLTDLIPVTSTHSIHMGCAVGPKIPVKNLDEYLKWAKADPVHASYGTGGIGSMPHFIAMLLGRGSGVPLNHVAYRGGGPMMQDLIGGNIPATCAPIGASLVPQHKSGQLNILAVADAKRMKSLPDVPTFAELGYKNIDFQEWMGVFVPAKTPPAIVAALNSAIQAAMTTPEMMRTLELYQSESEAMSPNQFSSRVKGDIERWRAIVKETGFVPE